MGRWRPPSVKGSAYITAAGAKRLKDELTHLWKVERPQVTQTVHEAAKNGDRSENGDYIDGNEHLWQIVGPDEFDVSQRKLSMDSPLAKAMLRKQLDDEIVLRKPEGEEIYYITAVEYRDYSES